MSSKDKGGKYEHKRAPGIILDRKKKENQISYTGNLPCHPHLPHPPPHSPLSTVPKCDKFFIYVFILISPSTHVNRL
jgi:hypothetical protein